MTTNSLKSRYKAVLFDLPGTLMSTDDDDNAHLHLMEALVEHYHLKTEPVFILEKFNALLAEPYEGHRNEWIPHRLTAMKAMAALVKEHGIATDDKDGEWFYKEYLKKHQTFVRLLPGARETLQKLAELGSHIGAMANFDSDYLDQQIQWLDLCETFDSITTAEEAGAPMPNQKLLRAALEKTAALPQQVILVSGSVARAIEPAKLMGMTTVLVDTGMTASELEAADFTVSHPARILNVLIELLHSP
jgi:FMN phosphatase YigB (HAD superfamily)